MPRRPRKPLRLRALTDEERSELTRLARSRKTEARVVERASILLALADGGKPAQIARRLGVTRIAVYGRLRRFNKVGLRALHDAPRTGRPATLPRTRRPKSSLRP